MKLGGRLWMASTCQKILRTSSPIPGVYHGMEIPFVFDTAWTESCEFTEGEKALSKKMQSTWADFAKTFHPGVVDQETLFPLFNNDSARQVVFRVDATSIEERYAVEECEFWAKFWNGAFRHAAFANLV